MVREMNGLIQLIGEQSVDELKIKLIDMIVEEVRSQLHEASEYIISPDEISCLIQEDIFGGIVEELKAEYKEEIKKLAAARFEKMMGELA